MFGVQRNAVSRNTLTWIYLIDMARLYLMGFDVDPFSHSSIMMIDSVRISVLLPASPFPNREDISDELDENRNNY